MRVLVVAGASGGHIFPALTFLDTLKDKFSSCAQEGDKHKKIDTFLVLPKGSAKTLNLTNTYKVRYLSISPVELKFNLTNIIALWRFFKGSLESAFIILEFRPDIVIGFGTINCVPLLLLAWIFRIKTLIHEQNVLPGMANRLLARFADRIAISFEETREYLDNYRKKLVLTGNPIRQGLNRIDKSNALSFFGFKEDKLTILIMGGSQGSRRINAAFLKTMSKLQDTSRLQLIHIAGIKDYELIKVRSKALNLNSRVFDFLSPMQYAYSASDLVVSRAGATSITEIMFFGLPAILIPYPYAYEHQLNNARVLEQRGCAFIIKDEDLDKDVLTDRIKLLMDNRQKLESMRSGNIASFISNAGDSLVNEVIRTFN